MPGFPCDAFIYELVGPDMKATQRIQLFDVIDAQDIRDLGPSGECYRVAGGDQIGIDEVAKLWFEQCVRFVKVGRVEQESLVRHLEMAVGLSDAAFSQEEDLIAGCERVDGGGPLFEG